MALVTKSARPYFATNHVKILHRVRRPLMTDSRSNGRASADLEVHLYDIVEAGLWTRLAIDTRFCLVELLIEGSITETRW